MRIHLDFHFLFCIFEYDKMAEKNNYIKYSKSYEDKVLPPFC